MNRKNHEILEKDIYINLHGDDNGFEFESGIATIKNSIRTKNNTFVYTMGVDILNIDVACILTNEQTKIGTHANGIAFSSYLSVQIKNFNITVGGSIGISGGASYDRQNNKSFTSIAVEFPKVINIPYFKIERTRK